MPSKLESYEVGRLETGTVQNALSENEIRQIVTIQPEAILHKLPPPTFKIQIINGNIIPAGEEVTSEIRIAGKEFDETFMVLPAKGNILIGMTSLKKYSYQ